MTIVTAQMSVSVDGFYAGPKHTDMQTWLEGPEAAGFFRVTRWAIDAEAWRQRLGFGGGEQNTNSAVIAETFEMAGAYVMGRRMADGGEIPWGDDPPFRAPVFVVTGRPRQALHRQGGTSFTYVTSGVESAIEMARAAANGKNVAIAGGGTLLRQVIKLGLPRRAGASRRSRDPRDRDGPVRPRTRPGRQRRDRTHPRPCHRRTRRHPHPLPGQWAAPSRPRQQRPRRGTRHRLGGGRRFSPSNGAPTRLHGRER